MFDFLGGLVVDIDELSLFLRLVGIADDGSVYLDLIKIFYGHLSHSH